jgi:hypothetical protein
LASAEESQTLFRVPSSTYRDIGRGFPSGMLFFNWPTMPPIRFPAKWVRFVNGAEGRRFRFVNGDSPDSVRFVKTRC